MFGFLNLNKPVEMTSRKAVDQCKPLVWRRDRPRAERIKLGHAGTLDPLASGVLIVALGPATRLIPYLQEAAKTYSATFQLGVESDSLDLETPLRSLPAAPVPAEQQLRDALASFVGDHAQVPPAYSAAKVNGRRAYRLARAGESVELQPRQVHLYSIELTRFEYPDFDVFVRCSTGTYIRSLGRDIAAALGSAAVMTALSRDSIGSFSIRDGLDPRELDEATIQDSLTDPIIAVNDWPQLALDSKSMNDIRHGVPLKIETADQKREWAAVDDCGQLMALLRRCDTTAEFNPFMNFTGYWDRQRSNV